MQSKPTSCGYIAIVGAPNAGKSTLLNRIVGTKLAIVTPKAQTTRNRILGITMRGESQMIFVDTPGIYRASERFERAMVESAISGARDADIVLMVVDAYRGVTAQVEETIARLKGIEGRKHLVLNKIDKVEKDKLLALTQALFGQAEFERCFMISARTGNGLDDLLDVLGEQIPEGPWLFPEDQLTDISERFIASEITRETIFLRLREELPYQVAVETEEWEERKDGSVSIRQVVFVRSESHKKIVIGNRGEMLKTIGENARLQMEKLQGRKVHLFLFVKVAKDWKDKREFYESIGLQYNA